MPNPIRHRLLPLSRAACCAALLARTSNPSDDDISAAMNGNICRCGTYLRIRQAVRRAASLTTNTAAGGGQ